MPHQSCLESTNHLDGLIEMLEKNEGETSS